MQNKPNSIVIEELMKKNDDLIQTPLIGKPNSNVI